MWRLVAEKFISYEVAILMSPDEILEANVALDIYIEEKNKRQKGGK
ncbi:hypothetical protein P4V34_28595 [Bacillus thuringiensis]|nr:hypothetical protein [Bacillus thuringiensis]